MTKNRSVKIGLIVIFVLTIFFHLSVLIEWIPFENVWGGRLQNKDQMLLFETVSILINLVFLIITLTKAGIIYWKIPTGLLRIRIWIMAALFALNTIGNLFAENNLEKYLATPLTLIMSILCLILAKEKP